MARRGVSEPPIFITGYSLRLHISFRVKFGVERDFPNHLVSALARDREEHISVRFGNVSLGGFSPVLI